MLGIGIGSQTSTGGVVIEGNDGVQFDGLVASSIGHKATCPACKKGVGAIVAVGPRTVTLPAGLAARVGDYIACGCKPGSNVLVAQGTVSIGSVSSGGVRSVLSSAAVKVPGSDKSSDAFAKVEPLRSNATFDEQFSHQESQMCSKDKAVYSWQLSTSQYRIRQAAFLPAEGVGVNGTFFIRGSMWLEGSSLFVSAMGFTAAQRSGEVQFYVLVSAELNGKEVFSGSLQMGKEAAVWPDDGYIPVGSADIELPVPEENDVVQITVSGSYVYSVIGGSAVPMPRLGATTIPLVAVKAE